MRDVSLSSLVNKVREIRLGKLTRLERENIGRKVRRQYLFKDAIDEREEEVVEEEAPLNEGEDENEETLTFEEWREQGNEEDQEDAPPREQIVVDRIDVWSSGETVRPVNEEEKILLERLIEVYKAKRIDEVPSLKLRDQKKVMEQIYLINGIVGNVSHQCDSISEVNHLLRACSNMIIIILLLTYKNHTAIVFLRIR